MSYFDVLDVAATGLSAQRIRMSVLSSNMANANTTRTEDGGPYRKKNVIFKQVLTGEHKGGVFLNIRKKFPYIIVVQFPVQH